MSFIIQATAEVVYSCLISDEDEERLKNFIKENPDEFGFCDASEAIIHAIDIMGYAEYSNLEPINIYEVSLESDFNTQEMEFDDNDRTAEEILGDVLDVEEKSG